MSSPLETARGNRLFEFLNRRIGVGSSMFVLLAMGFAFATLGIANDEPVN